MTYILQDLRYGLRMLWRSKGFTLVAVTALALGIGANTAIFSVVNAVLLRPLPFDQPQNIVRMISTNQRNGLTGDSHSFLNFSDIRDQNHSFEQIAAFDIANAALTGVDTAEQINGVDVSANIFDLLRSPAQIGRTFSAADEQPGGAEVVVISNQMWQKRFGSDPGILGRKLILNGKSRSIIGVMPAAFNFVFVNEPPEYWLPLDPKGDMSVQRGASFLEVIGRLKPGVDIKQAEADVESIYGRLQTLYPEDDSGRTVRLVAEHEHMVGNVRPTLLIILAAVGFVLLIACANVANLLLARATGRGREIAVRAALGASRFRIVRQLLTESIILAALGGIAGLAIAAWGFDLLVSFVPASIGRLQGAGLDSTVLLFTLGATVLTGILFGVAPAFQMSRIELNESLKEGGRGSTDGRGRNRLRSLLIVSEVALSLMLLVGAGLLIRSFFHLRNVNPGFNPESVLTASISLPAGTYASEPEVLTFYQQLLEKTRQLPGVESASAIVPLPLSNSNFNTTFTIDGQPDPGPGRRPLSAARVISTDYFKTMRIAVVEGRPFSEKDDSKSPPVLMINQTLARQFFSGESPVGKRIKVGLNDLDGEIVGVVSDVKHRYLDAESGPEYYVPLPQVPIEFMSLVIRSKNADPSALAAPVRDLVRNMDHDLPVFRIRPMSQLVNEAVARQKFSMTLIALFAVLALLLAIVGIFSVMSFLVAQRTHEFGIRIALGAQSGNILGIVVKQGMKLVLIGLGVGLALSLVVTRVMNSMLYEVGSRDPVTLVSVSIILALIALVACLAPAFRATRVDPIVALREE